MDVKTILLCTAEENTELSNQPDFIDKLFNGKWVPLLKNPLVKTILNTKCDINSVADFIKSNDSSENHLNSLSIGISSLFLFIQCNWTSQNLSDFEIPLIEEGIAPLLAVDGEDVNVNIRWSVLLLIAKTIFNACCSINPESVINRWWCLRSLVLHQTVIDESSPTLLKNIEEGIAYIESKIDSEIFSDHKLKARFYVEAAKAFLLYGKISKAEQRLNLSLDLLGIEIDFVGALGRRTKFQKDAIAQIRLDLKFQNLQLNETIEEEDLPEIVNLNDEIRHERIQWENSGGARDRSLSGLEQSLLLLKVNYMRRAMPQDSLIDEQTLPILEAVLSQKSCWTTRVSALSISCLVESKNKRTVERALAQNESLITSVETAKVPVKKQIGEFFALFLPPLWKLKAQLADLMLSVGLVKASLEYFLSLQLWEEVIVCYTILQLRHKAAEIIQQEIAKKPTVKLLCLLGDATDDVTYYERAWELSNHRSSKPSRHWGNYLFAKKQYFESIPHYQRSLGINSLQAVVWLRLGYAALSTEQWEIAATAYRRYTNIEPNSFEAWNNLARVYIALGDKSRAHKALSEALKTSFDNWQVWDNFMVASIDTGHFDDVIRSYHRLLDLKQKHLDTEVLSILVEAVHTDKLDHEGHSTARLTQKCLELLGRVSSVHVGDYRVWELYAKLSPTASLRVQRLQRAYRALVQSGDWAKDKDKCGKVLEVCIRLGESSLEANDKSLISSVRLTLRSALKAASDQEWPQYEDSVTKLSNILNQITNNS